MGVRVETADQAIQRALTLREKQWLALVNDAPDRNPHTFVVGSTGSGKTTLARAILAHRTGFACVITPKSDDHWGLPFVTLDSNIDAPYASIDATADALLAELQQRFSDARDGIASPPLTIIIDDAPQVLKWAPRARALFERVAQLGRSARVRLIVMSQSARVKSLNIEGESDMLENFVRISIDRQRVSTLYDGADTYTLITRNLPRMAARRLSVVPWYMFEPPCVASGENESATPATPATPATSATVAAQKGTQQATVAVAPRVTDEERTKIIWAAIELQQQQGTVSRREVCRRVFDGQQGGKAYEKVKSVLDRVI